LVACVGRKLEEKENISHRRDGAEAKLEARIFSLAFSAHFMGMVSLKKKALE